MLFYWFELGLYISLVLLPFAVCLLLFANYQIFFTSSPGLGEQNTPILEPIIPGVNLPASEFGYYAFALLICSIVHEFGHALAAVKEDVHMIDLGINIILFLPMAFVNISTEKLSNLNHWGKLRILCAGVWHNLVLMVLTGIIFSSLPFLLSPFYFTQSGVIVTNIKANSHLLGDKGLQTDDIITKINDCAVLDEVSWQQCLSLTRVEKPGFCIHNDLANELDETGPFVQLANGAWDCCAPNSPTHMCFEYLEQFEGVVELPQHICLPGRKIVEESKAFCTQENRQCPTPSNCIKPLLDNLTSLIVMSRDRKSSVVYIGHPADVFTTIEISEFLPKFNFISADFANVINKLIKYVTVFSGGLVVINILPCLFFDGQHIFNALSFIVLKNKMKKQSIGIFSGITTVLGTLMLFVNFVQYLWTFLFNI